MYKLSVLKRVCIAFLFFAAAAIALPVKTTAIAPHVQVLTTLYSFDATDGWYPVGPLVQGADEKFYGVTDGGYGTVFSVTSSGTLTTLHTFDYTDGDAPNGGLVQDADGKFYGTTYFGGSEDCNSGCGTVFSITAGGTLMTLHSFDNADGRWPGAGLVQGTDGTFYGTTAYGGTTGNGTVFEITSTGVLTTLHNFCPPGVSGCPDGAHPHAVLVQGSDGNFYGVTAEGGPSNCNNSVFVDRGCGTVFRITPDGVLTTLHLFNGTDGSYPVAALVQGSDGIFYGTTVYGGVSSDPRGGNCAFRKDYFGCGTLFSITPGGAFTTLHEFCVHGYHGCSDGKYPQGGLVQGADGKLYGTTYNGNGIDDAGTVFTITTSGALTTLHRFDRFNGSDGAYPDAGLIQATNGKFYGTTAEGGAYGYGTVFSITGGGRLSSNVPFQVLP